MSLDIIGAGFGRTGTLSVQHALNTLGFPCYHMVEAMGKHNPTHLDFWCEVAEGQPGTQYPWDKVFANYRATVDNPGCCVWRELLAANPDAKVLLTLHPKGAEAWYDSTVETIYKFERTWQYRLLAFVTPRLRKISRMIGKLVWQRSHRGTMGDRNAAIARYTQHVEEVKAAVPPERLLVFSVNQGWKPLCDFLNVPVPDVPFPNVNDRRTIKKQFYLVVVGVTVAQIVVFGLLAWLGYTLFTLAA